MDKSIVCGFFWPTLYSLLVHALAHHSQNRGRWICAFVREF